MTFSECRWITCYTFDCGKNNEIFSHFIIKTEFLCTFFNKSSLWNTQKINCKNLSNIMLFFSIKLYEIMTDKSDTLCIDYFLCFLLSRVKPWVKSWRDYDRVPRIRKQTNLTSKRCLKTGSNRKKLNLEPFRSICKETFFFFGLSYFFIQRTNKKDNMEKVNQRVGFSLHFLNLTLTLIQNSFFLSSIKISMKLRNTLTDIYSRYYMNCKNANYLSCLVD